MKNLMAPFNTDKALLAITSYLNPKDEMLGKKEFSAMGAHSDKTLNELTKYAPVVVLAEKRDGPAIRKINDDLLVKRVWGKGNPFSIFSILHAAFTLSKIRRVFVQFEFNVFGGIIPNLALLLTLAILRLTGRTVTFELHQVITEIALLKKHINITNPLVQRFFDLGLRMFYVILGLVANDILVFEEELKTRLSPFVKADKIKVLSLPLQPQKLPESKKSRDVVNLRQDEFIILVFGFINGYKGIDWIIKALKDYSGKKGLPAGRKVRLVIAGGENPYLKDQPHYQKFYQSIVTEAKKYPHVTLTGFVPESDIKHYFAAANVVVMPYEVFMAASGPFSIALSYGKPLLLSERLSQYAQSHDFKASLVKTNLTEKDVFFKLTSRDLIAHLEKTRTSPAYTKQLAQFTSNLALMRSNDVVIKRLYTIITSPSPINPLVLGEKSLSIN